MHVYVVSECLCALEKRLPVCAHGRALALEGLWREPVPRPEWGPLLDKGHTLKLARGQLVSRPVLAGLIGGLMLVGPFNCVG